MSASATERRDVIPGALSISLPTHIKKGSEHAKAGSTTSESETEVSKSQMPMNIRGDMWGIFNGKYYDTNNPNKNIELGTLLVKQIYNSLDNPTVDRIITLWNSLRRNTISSFGYRGRKMYNLRPWNL